jgi:hypothetical protein
VSFKKHMPGLMGVLKNECQASWELFQTPIKSSAEHRRVMGVLKSIHEAWHVFLKTPMMPSTVHKRGYGSFKKIP